MTYYIAIFQRILWTVAGFVLLLIVLSTVIMMLDLRIEMNSLRQPLQTAAQQALGRKVQVHGELSLLPTLWPTLEARNVQIANPRGWKKGDFAEVDLLHIQLNLLPLLRKEIQAHEIIADGLTFNLQNNLYGQANWNFNSPDSGIQKKPKPTNKVQVPPMLHLMDKLILRGVTVNYRDQKIQRTLHWRFDELEASLPKYGPFKMQLRGKNGAQPYQLNMTGGNVDHFFDHSQTWPVKLDANIAGTSLSLEGNKTRGNNPELKAKIEISQMNVGAVMDWLGVVNGIDASTESIVADVVIRGDSLSALLERSEMQLTLVDVLWTLSDINTGRQLPIAIKQGTLTVKPEAHLKLSLDSSIDSIPVAVTILGGRLLDYASPGAELPVAITAQGVGVHLSLQSSIAYPLEANILDFTLRIKGRSLRSLNPLLQLELPPIGPYTLKGDFSTNSEGYRINNLEIQVGKDNLKGFVNLETKQNPPRLTMQLQGRQLQLDDYALSDWSLTKVINPSRRNTGNLIYENSNSDVDGQFVKLLHPQVLNSLDANVSLRVEQVLSGKEAVGPGALRLQLEKGKLQLNPVQVDIPEGKLWLRWQFYPTEQNAEVAIQAKVENFEYGILARRIDVKSRAAGKLSLDIDLQAQTNNLHRLLDNSSGRFDFAVWPNNKEFGVFDLWSANMLKAVVSNVDKYGKSKINCAIAGFNLENGIMQDRLVYVDTSRVIIKGDVKVDFRSETVDALLQPETKSPEFFSLETPVKIDGHFKDFSLDVSPALMVGSVISFVSTPHAELNQGTLTDKSLSVSGKPECEEVWKTHLDQ